MERRRLGNSAIGRFGRAAVALALAGAVAPAGLAAQKQPDLPWKDSFYPVLTSFANNFPLVVIHYEQRKGADYFARTPYAGLFSLDVGASTAGSRIAIAKLQAPLLIERWRLAATLGATRASRFGYFGLGNDSDYDSDNVRDNQPFFYRARRSRYVGEVEVSRQLSGPFYVALAGALEHSNLSDLPRPSMFRTEQGDEDVTDTDARGRLTLVFDTRDNEFNTSRGLFGQTSLALGSGGDGYSRVTADLRGYIPLREGTVVAARVAGSALSDKAPLNARFEMPVWEGEVSVLGGTNSNRGLDFQRLAGKGLLMGSVEVRHDLLNLGDLGAFTLFGFVDAGRVFEAEDFKLTTEDMKVGAGGGLAIRLLRFLIWSFNFAGGPDGFQFSVGTGWSY